jgi:hypothetical protein
MYNRPKAFKIARNNQGFLFFSFALLISKFQDLDIIKNN